MGMDAGRKGPKSNINITPYIDILLVLLIIFMVVTPVRQMKLDAKVPQPPPPEPTMAVRPDVIVVSIGESAQIAINQVPTEIGSLGSKLQEIYSARRNKDMFISASPKLLYGDVVMVPGVPRLATTRSRLPSLFRSAARILIGAVPTGMLTATPNESWDRGRVLSRWKRRKAGSFIGD